MSKIGRPGSGYRLTRKGKPYPVRECPLRMRGICATCRRDFAKCVCHAKVRDRL